MLLLPSQYSILVLKLDEAARVEDFDVRPPDGGKGMNRVTRHLNNAIGFEKVTVCEEKVSCYPAGRAMCVCRHIVSW